MTIDEAIKHAEEVAEEKRYEYQECVVVHDIENANECAKCGEEHEQLAEWLKELKRLREQTKWIPVSERLPEADEEYHTFLVTDKNGRVVLSDFYLTLKDRTPYWSGMVDVIAWMPLPAPYTERGDKE